MAFEFTLLALIDANSPIELRRYDKIEKCQNDASSLTNVVRLNYTDLKYDATPVKEQLMQMLNNYNARWEAIQIPLPKPEEIELSPVFWVPSLISNISDVITLGAFYDLPELVIEAKKMQLFANEILDNAERPEMPNAAVPDYMLNLNEISYKCIVAPKQ